MAAAFALLGGCAAPSPAGPPPFAGDGGSALPEAGADAPFADGAAQGADAGGQPRCTAATACASASGSPPGAGWQCVKTLDVSLVDQQGKPQVGTSVSCCGRNLCLNGKSDASGHAHVDVCYYLNKPVFELFGHKSYVSFLAPIPSEEVVALPVVTLIKLPDSGASFPSPGQAGSVTSNQVTLSVTPSTVVTIDPVKNPTPDDILFRAVDVPAAMIPPSEDDPSLGLELFFGLEPFGATFEPPVAVTLPNTGGWAADTQVELFILGAETNEKYAPFAGWRSWATGHVSHDAQTIATDPGTGVPQLSTIGIKRK